MLKDDENTAQRSTLLRDFNERFPGMRKYEWWFRFCVFEAWADGYIYIVDDHGTLGLMLTQKGLEEANRIPG